MCHNRKHNNKINRLHERCLRLIYNDKHSSFPHVKTVNYGLESIPFLGPKIWESVPNDLKRKESVSSFKTAIKKWKPEQCPCRLCKTYLQNIGYL